MDNVTGSIFQSLQFKVEILRATFSCADFAHLKKKGTGMHRGQVVSALVELGGQA